MVYILLISLICPYADGSADSRRLGQLQVLYNARGRKIEELDLELKTLTESSEREARILKHKLALCEDEREGLKVSFIYQLSISETIILVS